MARLETEHVFSSPIAKVYSGISQFSLYPEYLPGVTNIDVLPAKLPNSICQVRYELHLVKKFYYILDMFAEKPNRIWWTLDESNIMKGNSGSWVLEDKGSDKTKATYSLDLKFKGLVPGKITDQIAKANLPAMLEGFQKLINDHG